MWYKSAGTRFFGMTIFSLSMLPDCIDGVALTTNIPSDDIEASRQYFLTSFQYSPVVFPVALGGGFPACSNFKATLHALLFFERFPKTLC